MAGTRERFRVPEAVARDLMRQQHEGRLTGQMLHEMNGLLGMRHDASSSSEATG